MENEFKKTGSEEHEKRYQILLKEKEAWHTKKIAEIQLVLEDYVSQINTSSKRYPMGKEQPVQLDCRNHSCKYHKNGACINEAPAITIINNSVTCWTKDME